MTTKPPVEYRPPVYGVPPKYWRDGMPWGLGSTPFGKATGSPHWFSGKDDVYLVPHEAVHGFDTAERSLDDLIAEMRKFPAEQLSAKGVVLPEPVDPYVELLAGLYAIWGFRPEYLASMRNGELNGLEEAALAYLKERVNLGEG